MQNIDNKIGLVKDNATREALMAIADELRRIKSIAPANTSTTSLAYVVNKIIGKL